MPMRGGDGHQAGMFGYVSPEQRIPADHPLRSIREMTDEVLRQLSPRFARLYAKTGRPSIAPEKLLRALLLQVLYSVRSERLLMEQLEYNLLFRWFVGLSMDDPGVGRDGVHEESRAAAARRRGRGLLPAGAGSGPGRVPPVRRALLGGRHAHPGLGGAEELRAQGNHAPAAGRSGQPHRQLPRGEA